MLWYSNKFRLTHPGKTGRLPELSSQADSFSGLGHVKLQAKRAIGPSIGRSSNVMAATTCAGSTTSPDKSGMSAPPIAFQAKGSVNTVETYRLPAPLLPPHQGASWTGSRNAGLPGGSSLRDMAAISDGGSTRKGCQRGEFTEWQAEAQTNSSPRKMGSSHAPHCKAKTSTEGCDSSVWDGGHSLLLVKAQPTPPLSRIRAVNVSANP